MNTWKLYAASAFVGCSVLPSCPGRGQQTAKSTVSDVRPRNELLGSFNADSAYQYIADQVAFGARVPGTPAHDATRDYIISRRARWQIR